MPERVGQLRLLIRHFLRRFLDNDLITSGSDLHTPLAAGFSALVIAFATVTLFLLIKYNPHEAQPLAEKLALALNDKTLLLGGAMLVMGIATLMTWDALSLDARDFAILGPLPVRTRTLLIAKVAAVATAAGAVAVAVNLLPAILFPVVVLANAPVGLTYGLRWMMAHAIAGLGACLFAFLAVGAIRAVTVVVLPSRIAVRTLPVLQFVLLLAFLTSLLVLPVAAMHIREALEAGRSSVYFWPPVWFLGLEERLIGRNEPVFARLAGTAAIALAISGAAACLAFVSGFLRTTCHFRTLTAGTRTWTTRALAMAVRRVADVVAHDPQTRASFFFTAQTLTRSPRHRLCVAAHLGLGLACVAASILAARSGISISRQPLDLDSMTFAAQGNLLFFLLVGVRVAAGFPADLRAAWIFRMRAVPAVRRYQAGTRWVFVLLGVVPLLLLLVPLHWSLWGWYAALVHLACGIISSLLLLQALFRNSRVIPFVAAFAPARTVLSLRLPFYLLGYLLFVYVPPDIERVLIRRPDLLVAWAGVLIAVAARFVAWQTIRPERDRMPVFDEEEEQADLGLGQWAPSDGDGDQAAGLEAADERRAEFRTAAGHGLGPARSAPPTRWLSLNDDAEEAQDEARVPRATWLARSEQLHREIAVALRRLRTAPAFTLFSVVTLAIAIGATTAIYSVIDAALLSPPHIMGVDSLVNLYHADPKNGANMAFLTFSSADYRDLRATQTVFSKLTAWCPFRQTLVANGSGEVVAGEMAGGEYFSLFGVIPQRGRMLQPADDRPGAPPVAVISDAVWRRQFAGDARVVGKTVRINGHVFEVVGVTPASFRGMLAPNIVPTAVWVPLASSDAAGRRPSGGDADSRDDRWLMLRGRLKRGRTVADAAAELASIGRRLDLAYPLGKDLPREQRIPPYVRRAWSAQPTASVHVNEAADASVLPIAGATMGAVALVLLVACTNLANLMLARGASRRQELAVRLALGASRWRLVREQVVESAIVAAGGAAAALVVARMVIVYVTDVTARFSPGVSISIVPTLNVSVMTVALGSTLLAVLVFGLAPALRLSRTDVRSALSSEGVNAASPRWMGRRNLIAGQVAVSVALLGVAFFCVEQVAAEGRQRRGVDLDRVAVARVDFRLQAYDEQRARVTLERILGGVRGRPGIEAAAISSGVPLATAVPSAEVTVPASPFVEGRTVGSLVHLVAASPAIFRTLGVTLGRGRAFDERDRHGADRVVVVDAVLARTLFPDGDAVGRQVLVRSYAWSDSKRVTESATVVGVASVIEGQGRVSGTLYMPFTQHYEPDVTVVARAARNPAPLVATLRDGIRRADPELAIVDAGTGTALGDVSSVALKLIAGLTGLLGALALVLAMAGLYGVLSYVVAGRTRELGVRVALGATRLRVARLVLADGIRPVLEGIAVGLGLAHLAGMALRPVFARVVPTVNPAMFALVALPFLAAALIACYLPARRAAAVDPNTALRHP